MKTNLARIISYGLNPIILLVFMQKPNQIPFALVFALCIRICRANVQVFAWKADAFGNIHYNFDNLFPAGKKIPSA